MTDQIFLFIETEINWTTLRILEETVVSFLNTGASEINLILSSPGGTSSAAVTCFNFLKSLEIRIKTYNIGDINLAPMLIFMAGIERYSVASGRFLLCQMGFETRGAQTIGEYETIIRDMQADAGRVREIYSSVLGVSMQKSAELLEERHWLDAYQARELGLVTKIAPLLIPKGAVIEILPLSGTRSKSR